MSPRTGEQSLQVLVATEDGDLLALLAAGEVGEHVGPDDSPVDLEEAQEPRERLVERRRLAVRGHLRPVGRIQPALRDASDGRQRGGVEEHDRVRCVEPEIRLDPPLLDAVGDPRVALELSTLDRLPLGIGCRNPSRLPVEPVEVDHRNVEDPGELLREPGLAGTGWTEDRDAPHYNRMELAPSEGKGSPPGRLGI